MKKTAFSILLASLAIGVAAAWAAPPSGVAAKRADAACKAMRGQIGPTAFSQAFGSLGGCVAALARVEQQNLAAAEAACTAEQNDANFAAAHSGQTFAQFYGVGPNGRSAYGRCLVAKANASSQAEGQSRPNPARLCSAQRDEMKSGPFATFYGTNDNHRNAFGKCVSRLAHTEIQNELTAAAACRAEQADAGFTAAHGKTFAQFYGTNDDLTNAFGKCVAAKAKAKTQAQQQATIAAVKACLAERKADRAAFEARYATFRACVVQHGG